MRCAIALAAVLAFSNTALAQAVETAMRDFGLLGTWAADCSKPAARDNIHSRFEIRDGHVLNVHDAGPTFFEDVYTVRAAKPAGADLLLIQSVSTAGKERSITLRRIGDKVQVWKVISADGFSPVNEGKYIVNGAAIAALSRCK